MYSIICVWSLWSWLNVNRSTFDEDMREKRIFAVSFPVTLTLTFDLKFASLITLVHCYISIFLRLSYFKKIGGTWRTDRQTYGRGATFNAAAAIEDRVLNFFYSEPWLIDCRIGLCSNFPGISRDFVDFGGNNGCTNEDRPPYFQPQNYSATVLQRTGNRAYMYTEQEATCMYPNKIVNWVGWGVNCHSSE